MVRNCRISSVCSVAWQLARFQLTRSIARSLGDSWASCYHCTACTVYFHCLHVHLLHVALNANQSIATYPPSRKLRLSCAPLSITAVHNLIIFIVITFSRPRLVVDFTTAGGDKRDNVKYRPAMLRLYTGVLCTGRAQLNFSKDDPNANNSHDVAECRSRKVPRKRFRALPVTREARQWYRERKGVDNYNT